MEAVCLDKKPPFHKTLLYLVCLTSGAAVIAKWMSIEEFSAVSLVSM